MKRTQLALVLWPLLAMASVQAALADGDPAKVTKAAYRAAMANFGFSPESLAAEKKWLAPELYAGLLKKANQPVPKGDAPDIEGDVLLGCQDPPTSFTVGSATQDAAQAKVPVTLTWPTESRHYVVLLKQVDGAWKIDEVDYGKDGKLTDLLK